jgi:predicted nucleic acid-binding protein
LASKSIRLLVVSDTGPLHYLVLTGDIELLPKLFERVLVPQVVHDELANREAPAAVRAWIAQAPAWLNVQPNPDAGRDDGTGPKLDDGERAVIALARAVKTDLVLMDDQDGVTVARRQGLAVTGTLGVLDLAARRGLVDLVAAFERLKATSFYYRQGLLDALLAQYRKGDDA